MADAGVDSSTTQPPATAPLPALPAAGAVDASCSPILQDCVLQFLLRHVRSQHVRSTFAQVPSAQFVEYLPVRLLAGTYNVNDQGPPAGIQLDAWLSQWKDVWPAAVGINGQQLPAGPDVVAVGFQEIVPLTADGLAGVTGYDNVIAWDRAIAAHLNGEEWAANAYPRASYWLTSPSTKGAAPEDGVGAAYLQVASKQMFGLYVSVWVRQRLLPEVCGVQVTAVATGFGGYVGNKGAVAVRMRVYDSPLVFVVAHLSSGTKEGDEALRNADVAAILRRTAFGPRSEPMTAANAALLSSSLGPGHWGEARSVMDHENAVWLGDLNYRLSGISDGDAFKAIRESRVETLLAADQLLQEMRAGRVFKGWTEPPITFLPTFKFVVGKGTYLGDPAAPAAATGRLASADPLCADGPSAAAAGGAAASATVADGGQQLSTGDDVTEPLLKKHKTRTESKQKKQKTRTPAYCDRVLWMSTVKETRSSSGSSSSGGGGALEVIGYGRGELKLSDHKPVAAALLLRARRFNREQVAALVDAAHRKAIAELRPGSWIEPATSVLPPHGVVIPPLFPGDEAPVPQWLVVEAGAAEGSLAAPGWGVAGYVAAVAVVGVGVLLARRLLAHPG